MGNKDKVSANDSAYQSLADSDINVNLYPNPADESIFIKINNYQGDLYEIKISDMAGKQVMSEQMKQNFIKINIGKLKQGLYLISIVSDSFIFNKKFIVK